MNANANSLPVPQEIEFRDNGPESDGDINDGQPTSDYYQNISTVDDDSDSDNDTDTDADPGSDSHQVQHSNLPNGYFSMDNGVSSLHINDASADHKSIGEEEDDDEGREEEEEDRDAAIRRAFREDESRRTAPLSVENAARVMEAMRGVRFSGSAPDWVQRVPEDQWLTHLHSLRQPPSSS